MFWRVILIAFFAVVFIKLGAYSVLISFLLFGLKGALLVLAVLVAVLLCRKIFGTKRKKLLIR